MLSVTVWSFALAVSRVWRLRSPNWVVCVWCCSAASDLGRAQRFGFSLLLAPLRPMWRRFRASLILGPFGVGVGRPARCYLAFSMAAVSRVLF